MISPLAYIDPSAQIDPSVTVHPFAYIGGDVNIDAGCEILPYASIMPGTVLGKNVKVYQSAVIGAEPQDFRWKGQPSKCIIGDNVIIREQVIINRSIHPDGATSIGSNVFVMAESHIGHDTVIMGDSVIGNGATIAGDAFIDYGCILSSNTVVHEGCRMGRFSMLKGGCRISSNVPPFVIIAHNPASFYGVNAVVMRRSGKFSEEMIDEAAKAYRHVYQCSTSVFNAVRRIETDIADEEIKNSVIGFIKDNDYKIVASRFLD